jgi:MoaA/NifB/PqqE/SkfB family radical SAM enzyme
MKITKQTFCTAPWFSVRVNNTGHLAPCCLIKQKKVHNFTQLEEYFHSPELNKLRQDLLQGVKNQACVKCWRDEDNGGDSLRLLSNRTLALHSKINLREQINEPKISNIKSFDLTLGNLCNLKCVMCSSDQSSQLLAEANLNPSLHKRYQAKFSQKDFDWPKGNDFVEWCSKHLPQAIHVQFSGGEPFILPWIHDAVNAIPDQQKSKCVLHFTTNLTVVNDKLLETFKKFKQVWLSVSVEGANATHEYLRYGHSWQTLSKNFKKLLAKKNDNLILKVNHVVQTPSYHSIIEMTRFFDSLNIEIRPILLADPKHFHISALAREAKQEFLDKTDDYKGHNQNFIQYVRSVSKEYIEQDHSLTHDCIEDLKSLDAVRGNDYKKVIPAGNLNM